MCLISRHISYHNQHAWDACYISRATARASAAAVSIFFASLSRKLFSRLGREDSQRGKYDQTASRAGLSRVTKESNQGRSREQNWPSSRKCGKETILKAREISIERLRKIPGRLLAADKNLLQTCQRAIDMERFGDCLDAGNDLAVVRDVIARNTASEHTCQERVSPC